jgi:uncharacterized protein (TIGR02145 family)
MRDSGINVTLLFSIAILAVGNSERIVTSGNVASRQAKARSVEDIDGNIYTTVRIGEQIWMAENLRTTTYRNGKKIPHVEDNEEWSSTVTGAYCYPDLEFSTETQAYGFLYNFIAVNDCNGLCPEGWHVPSMDEWRELANYLGGINVAGGKLKSTDTRTWNIQVEGTTNESGFTALPAGGRGRVGGAGEVGNYATWWSSTVDDFLYAWHWGLHPDKHQIRANPGHVLSGFFVRCVKDRNGP